ncbi:MFS transporter [Nocardioides sp.]|uniref:MFS transporter n=1 Tax=Nocardioides sp. TaxID=35761 RepID=UPI002ED3E969
MQAHSRVGTDTTTIGTLRTARPIHPVLPAVVAALVLHGLWVTLVASSGGDLAAQDAWAEFARDHPGSAYNFAWYGGMHPASYSLLSPYVMAALGVRVTLVLAGTVSAGLLALLLLRDPAVRRPTWPALYGALALTGSAVSGRVTFALGTMCGLAALAVVQAWQDPGSATAGRPGRPRAVLAGTLSALATASSPVAGLFLGVVAAASWLAGRRTVAWLLGGPPLAVIALSSLAFPFSGRQPMGFSSTILPVALALACWVLAPPSWRTVRLGALLYTVGVIAVWMVPSPIGSNMNRLGLVFGGTLLVAIAAARSSPLTALRERRDTRATVRAVVLATAITTASVWQVAVAARDVIHSQSNAAWNDLAPLVRQLERRGADRGRVEVVPTRSHREASALAPYVNLARGWNRQADTVRNPVFYEPGALTPASYRTWLSRWAVQYVVLATGPSDVAAQAEARLVATGPNYLSEVWSDDNWRLFEVLAPTPLVDPPAEVTAFDADQVVITMPDAGTVLVRIPYSPWLGLVDEHGSLLEPPEAEAETPADHRGCLSESVTPSEEDETSDSWTVLHAPEPGSYRIAAPYGLGHGTTCPPDVAVPNRADPAASFLEPW